MTIDRTVLRQLYALTLTANGDEYWDAMFKCRTSIPALLDALDAKDRRIAELESDRNAHAQRIVELQNELAASRCSTDALAEELNEAELKLSIATELNVNDRKQIASLESQLAASRDIIRHFEQERDSWPAAYRERAKRTDARIERLQAGLATIRADLLSLKANNNGASPATCERIMQKVDDLLPSEET